jgi:glycosyltransferase involved in cell wall biosynthesis
MKILQLCKKFPFPLKDGESIAITSLARSLAEQGCEVTLLAMNTRKHYFNLNSTPNALSHYKDIYATDLDNRIKISDAFWNLFSKESYHIQRFINADFEKKLISILRKGEFDVVQLETLYLAPYISTIRKYSDAIIAMRSHNVEHEIWERITENTSFLPKRLYLKHLTQKLKRYEIEVQNQYDLLIPISRRDEQKFKNFGYKGTSKVIPIGVDSDRYSPDYDSYQKEISISFIGSLDWMPNQEGLKWFLDKVWAKLSKRNPNLSLHIAGRNTPKWISQLKRKNVKVYGEVPCAHKFINEHSIMVVPLLSGSGMRAKILEGMSLGKVVLTTPIGLEGIHAKDKKEVLIAETVAEFEKAINYCYQNKNKLERIGRRAKEFVSTSYDSDELAKDLIKEYSSLMVEVI